MRKSEVDYAERKAIEEFDKWNDVTGFVQPCTSYYDEFRSVLEDAVHIGIHMALYGKIYRNEEDEIEREVKNPVNFANVIPVDTEPSCETCKNDCITGEPYKCVGCTRYPMLKDLYEPLSNQ